MIQVPLEAEKCREEAEVIAEFYQDMPSVVGRLLHPPSTEACYDHVGPSPIPSHEEVIGIVQQARRILFPGYFCRARLDKVNLEYHVGLETTELFERLTKQIGLSVQHDCFRYDLACSECVKRGHEAASSFIHMLPDLRCLLAMDVRAALDGDPAASSADEVIFSYPGLFAITVYRIAHALYELGVPLLPRMMTEYAHGLTGIDIHPGAEIGESFFIDHGTGVVVGKTTVIGNRVRFYQGVTLGALSLPKDEIPHLKDVKRHPTIEDDVIIYSNATILGGETVIGARSIIGGNVWITESVPPDTKVILKKPELIYFGNSSAQASLTGTERRP